jgi:alpha-tubulin suppressor-like RCC1 family protein
VVLALALVVVTGAGGARTARPALATSDLRDSAPTIVPAKAIAAGGEHTCAISRGGAVRCWGGNSAGQLGDGTTTDRSRPVGVLGLGLPVTAVALGWRHTCALTTAGGVKCWGHNGFGQLGDGTGTGVRAQPVGVSGLDSGVIAVAAGGDHSCALIGAGGVKCWGQNSYGELGDGTTTDRSSPVDVTGLGSGVTAIATGGSHSCAITTTGAVNCWGFNRLGQVGDGTTSDRRAPVQVAGLSGRMATVVSLVGHSCGRTETGSVKCWGNNTSGSLGDGTTAGRLTPVDALGVNNVASVVTGGGHTCALLSRADRVRCWGLNESGQLGDGTTNNRLSPVSVPGLGDDVAAIATGGAHSCALTSLGAVKCWGGNRVGEVGDGTTRNRRRPVDVAGFGIGRAALRIVPRSVAVTPERAAPIGLRCGSQARCRGKLILVAFVKGELVGSAADAVPLELGRRTFSIAASRTQAVRVVLTGRSFNLLVRLRRLATQVHVRYKQPAGGDTKTLRTIALTAPGPAKG